MDWLTCDERQRVFRVRETAAREILGRLAVASVPLAPSCTPTPRRRRHLAAVGLLLMVLGGGWLFSSAVEIHPPVSFADALWPRQ
jgi:hypothetical protein